MLLGLLFIALGAALLLSQILSIDFMTIVSTYWPIFLIIYGVLRLFKRDKSKITSVLIIGIGLVVQLNSLGYFSGNSGLVFVALLLIIAGVRIIIGVTAPEEANVHSLDDDHSTAYQTTKARKKKKANYFEQKDFLNERFLFTSDQRIYQSENFTGGFIEASFSNVHIDLKNVWSQGNEIALECKVNFSTLTIDVPSDWHVIVNGKHYYSKNEVEFEQAPTATLIINSKVTAGTLKVV